MLHKLKKLLSVLKKSGKWITIAALALLVVWGIRSCTKSEGPKKSLYRIGRDSSWYPVPLFGKEKNLVAFTNDILGMIASEHNLRFEWVAANPNTLTEGLNSGFYDFILTTMRPNIVNEERYEFSELVFEFGPVLIVRQESEATSLSDMRGLTIGIPSGLSTVFNAVRSAGAHSFDLLVVTYNNMNQAFKDLSNNQIDGVIIPALQAYSFTQGIYAGKLKVVTAPFTDEGLRFVALRSSKYDEILDIINKSLETMHANGAYNALIAKWDLIDAETGFWRAPTH